MASELTHDYTKLGSGYRKCQDLKMLYSCRSMGMRIRIQRSRDGNILSKDYKYSYRSPLESSMVLLLICSGDTETDKEFLSAVPSVSSFCCGQQGKSDPIP